MKTLLFIGILILIICFMLTGFILISIRDGIYGVWDEIQEEIDHEQTNEEENPT
jgi:hypothetical protein